MSVKSERRAWYAVNVEPKPAGEPVGSPIYMDWVKRANVHMARVCKPGTSELRDASGEAPARVAPVARLKVARDSADAADRAEYEAFLDSQRARIADHMGWPGELWDDFFRPQTHGANARRRPAHEFCKGALHIAWPHLTEEMQRAHEAGVFRWVTFAEYKRERVAERAAMAEAYSTEGDAADEICVLCMGMNCDCDSIDWAA